MSLTWMNYKEMIISVHLMNVYCEPIICQWTKMLQPYPKRTQPNHQETIMLSQKESRECYGCNHYPKLKARGCKLRELWEILKVGFRWGGKVKRGNWRKEAKAWIKPLFGILTENTPLLIWVISVLCCVYLVEVVLIWICFIY